MRVSARMTARGPLFDPQVIAKINQAIREAIWPVGLRAQALVARRTPVGATGKLRQSISLEPFNVGPIGFGVRIFSPLVYAPPVEFGSRPHFPPIEPIEYWVRRKLRITGKTSRQVAYLVARAISRRGTRAVETFQTTYQRDVLPAVQNATRVIGRAIKTILGGS